MTGRGSASLLVVLPALPPAQFATVLTNLAASLPAEELLIAAPEGFSAEAYPAFQFAAFSPLTSSWTLTAAEFASAGQLAEKHHARALILLGPECATLGQAGLRELASAALTASADLIVPRYTLPPLAGLVNSAILYPLTRTLFATRTRFPLAVDLGLSLRMAERLAMAAQQPLAANQGDAPLWPVHEASVAGMTIEEVDVGPRQMPQPTEPDLHTILPFVIGSLFYDIEAKAAFWQRARVTPPGQGLAATARATAPGATADVAQMLQTFRLACKNLQEIWGLVLPPNSLLNLKRLSQTEDATFRMPDTLWARIIFDFLVAYRLRTLNRSHLLGALIPLYLAWAASHINLIASGVNPERHIEAMATTFEADKPYLVARWRWPDRFNP